VKVLVEKKPKGMEYDVWATLNKNAITYIKMVIFYEILVDIKGLTTTHQVWQKPNITYKNITPTNQVRLMRKLVSMRHIHG
jgi:hypothetical protein